MCSFVSVETRIKGGSGADPSETKTNFISCLVSSGTFGEVRGKGGREGPTSSPWTPGPSESIDSGTFASPVRVVLIVLLVGTGHGAKLHLNRNRPDER